MGNKNKSKKINVPVKSSIFKVAGAKSLKKTKAKAVNLGLKDIRQKIQESDKQFSEIKQIFNKKSPTESVKTKQPNTNYEPKQTKNITIDDVSKTAEEIVKMDL